MYRNHWELENQAWKTRRALKDGGAENKPDVSWEESVRGPLLGLLPLANLGTDATRPLGSWICCHRWCCRTHENLWLFLLFASLSKIQGRSICLMEPRPHFKKARFSLLFDWFVLLYSGQKGHGKKWQLSQCWSLKIKIFAQETLALLCGEIGQWNDWRSWQWKNEKALVAYLLNPFKL